jgi:Zn-dependent peptidase ImmA (M78 family)/transcriptional regulator with XRE-family HTH domain
MVGAFGKSVTFLSRRLTPVAKMLPYDACSMGLLDNVGGAEDLRQVVGTRLTAARERTGLSQARAAELLGIDRPRLSGIERGERPLDVSMLVRVAELYGVTASYVVGASVEEISPPELRLRSAIAENMDSHQGAAELSGFLKLIERFRRLLTKTKSAPEKPDIIGFTATTGTRKHAVEADAKRLRDLWGLSDAPVGLRIFDLLEEHHVSVFRAPLADSSISGAFIDAYGVGALIFVNAREWPYRQVFTAAHELAHLLYHGGAGISLAQDTSADESLANAFASAFLMPESAVTRFLSVRGSRSEKLLAEDVVALHRAFGVSYYAALVRLKRLGLVRSNDQYDALARERPVLLACTLGYEVEPWEFHYNPEEVSPRNRLRWLPRKYLSLVRKALDAGEITDRQAARMLNLDYEDWAGLHNPPTMDQAQLDRDREDTLLVVR